MPNFAVFPSGNDGLATNSILYNITKSLQNEFPEDEDEETERMASLQNVLPAEVLARSSTFPIAPANLPNLEIENLQLQNLIWYLPPAEKAVELKEIYYQHAAWMYVNFAMLNHFRKCIDARA